MKRINGLILLFFLLAFVSTDAQEYEEYAVAIQYPIYSQYLIEGLFINPAYAGTREALSMSFSGRKRMLGFDGEYTLGSFAIHAPLKKDRIALGFSVNQLSYGVTKQTSLYSYYAFHIKTLKGRWSLGLKAGTDLVSHDYSEIITHDPDVVFETGQESHVMPNVGAGVYYSNDRLFAGVAVPALLTYKVDTTTMDYRFEPDYKYYDILASAGALLTISEMLKLKPSVMLKYSMTNSLRADMNLNFIIADVLWLGGSWRTGENAVVGIIDVQITPQLKLGYSYDYSLGMLSDFIGGTHEVALRFDLNRRVDASTPRYF
ncbi:MAG: type IX secretion system membrane protein PorP/SprF [Bacteroidales bacterium]|nr:type IX secretion system membrane protein PorP/SprF [Bacteroidales bacterium]